MYVTISSQKIGGNYSGSSSDLVNYLEKENEGLGEEKELFFNEESKEIDSDIVIENLDNNKGKLKKKDAKFYNLTLNPSAREIKHIERLSKIQLEKELKERARQLRINTKRVSLSKFSKEEVQKMTEPIAKEFLKEYTRDMMEEYAKNFGREINGKPLSSSDLMWYAKIETQRKYSRFDPRVKENMAIKKEIKNLKEKGDLKKAKELESKMHKDYYTGEILKEGVQKGGGQYHAHVIVSRLDKINDRNHKMSLSPMANARKSISKGAENVQGAKIGFNRDNYKATSERIFDEKFTYDRDVSYQQYKDRAKGKSLNGGKILEGQIRGRITSKIKEELGVGELKRDLGLDKLQKVTKFKSMVPKSKLDVMLLPFKLVKEIGRNI